MGYVVVGLLVLGGLVYLAINIGYTLFAGVMMVVNPIAEVTTGQPAVHLHGDIMAEVRANTTVSYEVVKLRSQGGAYAADYQNYQINFTATNRSRWKITNITPVCTVSYMDGTSARLTNDTSAVRTSLDSPSSVETGALPGQTVQRTLATQQIRNSMPSAVRRADCTFDYTINWWVWNSETAKQGSGS